MYQPLREHSGIKLRSQTEPVEVQCWTIKVNKIRASTTTMYSRMDTTWNMLLDFRFSSIRIVITFWKISLSSMYLNTVMKLVSLSSTSFSVIPFADFFSRLSQYFASCRDNGQNMTGSKHVYTSVCAAFVCASVWALLDSPVLGLYRWTWVL